MIGLIRIKSFNPLIPIQTLGVIEVPPKCFVLPLFPICENLRNLRINSFPFCFFWDGTT